MNSGFRANFAQPDLAARVAMHFRRDHQAMVTRHFPSQAAGAPPERHPSSEERKAFDDARSLLDCTLGLLEQYKDGDNKPGDLSPEPGKFRELMKGRMVSEASADLTSGQESLLVHNEMPNSAKLFSSAMYFKRSDDGTMVAGFHEPGRGYTELIASPTGALTVFSEE